MTDTCVAAVAVAPNKMELQEFPLPNIGEDDALLKIEAVGLCGADSYMYKNIETPMILGHECVGTIAEIGQKAKKKWGVKQGDRIVVEEPFPCGHCRVCRTQNYQLCPNSGRYGKVPVSEEPFLWGGFSEFMYLHPNSLVYKIPEDMPAEIAPMFIPISNGIRWVQQVGKLGIGETVIIQGPGQHGLGCVIAAREAGAERIIVTGKESDKKRLEIAKKLGADYTINVDKEDLLETVAMITINEMADLVIDITTGATEPVSKALDITKVGGTIVLAGAKNKAIPEFLSDKIFRKELTVTGVYGRDYRAVIPALKLMSSGKYPLHKLSSHVFSLKDIDYAMRVFAGEVKEEMDRLHISVLLN